MCDKSVDPFLPFLKFVLDCFFKNKMLEKSDSIVFSNDDIDMMI